MSKVEIVLGGFCEGCAAAEFTIEFELAGLQGELITGRAGVLKPSF